MNIVLDKDILFWNKYLNLEYLNKNTLPNNCKIKKIQGIGYKGMSIDEWTKLLNLTNEDNICISIINPQPRLYLLDLYNMEEKNLVKKGLTKTIINDLRKAFFKKHKKCKQEYFVINIYIRLGDLARNTGPYKKFKEINFEFNILKYISKLFNDNNTYKINIISAGTNKQMNNVKNKFGIFKNVNFMLNLKQDIVFLEMVNSDMLIYNVSSFPFIASLYCDGVIISSKNNKYMSSQYFYKDEKFLDNYILIKDSDTDKLYKFINKDIIFRCS